MDSMSRFKDEYVEQAHKLCLLGALDVDVADFFGVPLEDLAVWAANVPAFLRAVTVTEEDIRVYRDRLSKKSVKRNDSRRAYLAGNISARVRAATSARVWAALKGRTDGRLFTRLGYSIEELMAHLEALFVAGMSWSNYGEWHIDHKRPCALFDQADPAQFAACWALSNLQPLWASDNIKKGASYAGA